MHPSEILASGNDQAKTAARGDASFALASTEVSAPERVQVVCAIPARFASERLPGKPLRMIAGKPMIQHTFERARSARGIDRAVVLTDDERIANVVRSFGGEVEMTPEDCKSGTDRIAWAARSWPSAPLSSSLTHTTKACLRRAVINVQGDEPLIDPVQIERVATHLVKHPQDGIVTLATKLDSAAAQEHSNVKVVTDAEGYALYFSRAAIPHHTKITSEPSLFPGYRLHIGLYGYQLDVLERLAKLEQSPLERAESLEQLRALENGIRIRVLDTDHRAFGVDTEADLERAEKLLTQESRPSDHQQQ